MTDFAPKDTTGNFRHLERTYTGGKFHKRNLILWQVPHLGNNRYIEMYINPQGITASNKKAIQTKRTKGGFILQYWGEDYESLNINGTTGDGGIEAVDALFDVYRSEQLAFQEMASLATSGSTEDTASQITNDLIKRRQPLGPLATSVVMWYMGQGKRGFFTDFQVDENVQANGTFSYRMSFTVVETINRRRNFMPWHRKPWSTSETPNVSSNGRVLVTGGYSGDTETRLGKLNSPAGDVRLQTQTNPDDPEAAPLTREVWAANPLFDPKYWSQDFPAAPLHIAAQSAASPVTDSSVAIRDQDVAGPLDADELAGESQSDPTYRPELDDSAATGAATSPTTSTAPTTQNGTPTGQTSGASEGAAQTQAEAAGTQTDATPARSTGSSRTQARR